VLKALEFKLLLAANFAEYEAKSGTSKPRNRIVEDN